LTPAPAKRRRRPTFIAVMGASNRAYTEATLTQSLPDWIGAHVAFMGGVPAQLD
jgi:transposase